MLNENYLNRVMKQVEKDKKTKDSMYNKGLQILKNCDSIEEIQLHLNDKEVEYYLFCNSI